MDTITTNTQLENTENLHRHKLLQALNLTESPKSFSHQFIEKANFYTPHSSMVDLFSGVKPEAGIYMFATAEKVLYVGYSCCTRARISGHSHTFKRIRGSGIKENIYLYTMYFEESSLIGKIYVYGYTQNYHESILINNCNPVFNRLKPVLFTETEEIWYRRKITKDKKAIGFSSFLLNDLLRFTHFKFHSIYRIEEYVELFFKSNKIINKALKTKTNSKRAIQIGYGSCYKNFNELRSVYNEINGLS